MRLIRTKGGVDASLDYAKTWSRYAKELLAWTEKRASYGEGPFCPAQTPGSAHTLSDSDPCHLPQSWSLPKAS